MENKKVYGLYYATKTAKVLIVADDPTGRNVVIKHLVTGKVQARKFCNDRGIIAWNF
jgi:hypothetical protein